MSTPIKRVVYGSSDEESVEPVATESPQVVSIKSIKSKLQSVNPAAEKVIPISDEPAAQSDDADIPAETTGDVITVPDEVKMDPSLYYQVRDLTNGINQSFDALKGINDAIKESADKLETIESALADPNNPDGSLADAVSSIRNDLTKVLTNLQMITNQVTINTEPSAYNNQVVTYELKQAGSIGLGPTQGMESTDHVFVTTVSNCGFKWSNFTTYQTATRNGKTTWCRQATDENTWTPWEASTGGGGSIIFSETQPGPSSQHEGDIWISPLDT